MESDGETAVLNATYIKEGTWVIDSIEYDGEDEAPLELSDASGESRVQIGFEASVGDQTWAMEFEPSVMFKSVDRGMDVVIDNDDLEEIASEIKTVYEELRNNIDLK